jgi:hypothetical protein
MVNPLDPDAFDFFSVWRKRRCPESRPESWDRSFGFSPTASQHGLNQTHSIDRRHRLYRLNNWSSLTLASPGPEKLRRNSCAVTGSNLNLRSEASLDQRASVTHSLARLYCSSKALARPSARILAWLMGIGSPRSTSNHSRPSLFFDLQSDPMFLSTAFAATHDVWSSP